MDPTGTERSPLFNQTNWSTWKENMRFLLLDRGCWSFIDGREPKLEDLTQFDVKKDTIAIFIARIRKHVKRLMDAGHPLEDMYPEFQSIRTLPPDFQVTEINVNELADKFNWIIDTAVTQHFCNNANLFTDLQSTVGKSMSLAVGGLESPIEGDVCGPLPVESRGGAKHFLSITDDFSRMVICFPLKEKSQVFECFKIFQANAERVLIRKILVCVVIMQNGVSERFSLTAMDCVKAMLNDIGVDKCFWERHWPEKTTISDDLDKTVPDTSASNLKPCSSIPFYRDAVLHKNKGSYDVYYRVKGQKFPHFRDALKSPQSDKWQEVKADEIQVMKDREAWKLVPAPKMYKVYKKCVLLLYVDDIVVFGKTQRDIDIVVSLLQNKVDIKILGARTGVRPAGRSPQISASRSDSQSLTSVIFGHETCRYQVCREMDILSS
ncbi:retrovirus-related Pol polyprotein from transposon TNT 1-94 [Caerostris extrusa]|uniref:Retrovirus-related Pol polyprotein from transposon TNT 1-94 n=1 Tax=Caerostris extrusa TaxID=172846 RepID=A0AAV4PTF8_CAEEX|nr:retrovirus-related Pol polyprotein from transposon TNT 1-94 [Caerostris extrusa]